MWIDEKFLIIKHYTAKYSNHSKSVIDLGARDQILLKFLPTNWRYTGVDKFAQKLNLNIDVEENFKDINDKYDFVIALDIIEHLNNPVKFFENCKKICNELIILNIPNAAYYQFRLNLLFTGELTEKFHFSGNFEDAYKKMDNIDNKDDLFDIFTFMQKKLSSLEDTLSK